MEQTIIALETPSLYLSKARGFLRAEKNREIVANVPLDDVAALVVNAHGLSYTNALIVALAERNVPIVLCGQNHMPAATVLPVVTNVKQAKYLAAQANLSKPKSKQIWAAVIKAKILWQIFSLQMNGIDNKNIERLSRQVKSGDPANVEAQAARVYWNQLMGNAFRRNVAHAGTNQLLNYGYTILRAGVCRGLISAGLTPGFGIHHCSATNPMQLVDDLMEPFRPLIDLKVKSMTEAGRTELSAEVKNELAATMHHVVPGNGSGPLMNHVYRLALDYRSVLIGDAEHLEVPVPRNKKPPKSSRKKVNAPQRISPDVAVSHV